MQNTKLSTIINQRLRGILAAICSKDGITSLSHILSSQPYAWPLATHLCPTDAGGINDDETYGNIALPSPSCEYYVHALGTNVKATISIYNPGEECGILFCNVAAYDVHGNPLLMLDDGGDVDVDVDEKKQCKKIQQQYDQLTPLPGETASKEWEGPIILVARYYKSEQLRSKWVSQIMMMNENDTEKHWSLPTIMIHNGSEQKQQLLPMASVEQQQRFTNCIGQYLKRAVVKVAPTVRLEQSLTLKFEVNDGQGMFPNPRSYYSYVNPNFNQLSSEENYDDVDDATRCNNQPIGVKICVTLPSSEMRNDIGLLFGDIMVVDMLSTRTVASLPSDCINPPTTAALAGDGSIDHNMARPAHGTCWGEEFTLYVLLADINVPIEITAALADDTNTFLLQWDKSTTVPGIVYRLVVERDLGPDEEHHLKHILTGKKNNLTLEWVY